ncbi:MAG: hypothetical protein ACRCYV_03990 [Aeromonas sp.]
MIWGNGLVLMFVIGLVSLLLALLCSAVYCALKWQAIARQQAQLLATAQTDLEFMFAVEGRQNEAVREMTGMVLGQSVRHEVTQSTGLALSGQFLPKRAYMWPFNA